MVEALETFGGWPVVKGDEWQGENWDWIEANKKMSDVGLIDSIILKIAVSTDSKNSLKRVISVNFRAFRHYFSSHTQHVFVQPEKE